MQPGGNKSTHDLIRRVTMRAKEDLDKKMGQNKLAVGYDHGNNKLQKSFQKLKSHLIENKDDYQNLDVDTKNLINKVIEIESSIIFRLSRHLMNRLDIFCRFWFPLSTYHGS